jgi:hypothetical protein
MKDRRNDRAEKLLVSQFPTMHGDSRLRGIGIFSRVFQTHDAPKVDVKGALA